uniref:Peptidase_M14 domain-containing protein n=1 Tax=Parastrongyloides trichosuri TaxID=131310 RepID=A0A0N5A1Y2_PARTI
MTKLIYFISYFFISIIYGAILQPSYNFLTYNRFGEIERYLKWAQYSYKNFVDLKILGTTYEGRPIYAIIVDKNKEIIKKDYFIISGVHAREWIGISSTLFFMNKLLNEINIDNNISRLLHEYRIHIIPVVNPDGYEYSLTVDSHWRKNRSSKKCLIGGKLSKNCCYGIDINRNFDYNFNKHSDPYECSESYVGNSPFSEEESKALSAYALTIRPYIVLDFHAFGNLIIYPFAYPDFIFPPTMNYLKIKGDAVSFKIQQKYNQKYKCGLAKEFLNYGVYGSSMDFYYGKIGSKYSYVIELGRHGFHPPISNIQLMGNIVYDMIFVFAFE